MRLRAGVGESGGRAEADERSIAQQAGDTGDDVAGGVLVRGDEDAEAGRADAEMVEGLMRGLEAGFASVEGLSASDSGVERHEGHTLCIHARADR